MQQNCGSLTWGVWTGFHERKLQNDGREIKNLPCANITSSPRMRRVLHIQDSSWKRAVQPQQTQPLDLLEPGNKDHAFTVLIHQRKVTCYSASRLSLIQSVQPIKTRFQDITQDEELKDALERTKELTACLYYIILMELSLLVFHSTNKGGENHMDSLHGIKQKEQQKYVYVLLQSRTVVMYKSQNVSLYIYVYIQYIQVINKYIYIYIIHTYTE